MNLGGQYVDHLVLIGICEMHAFSTASLSHNFFGMFRRNDEFLGCWRVDLADEKQYNWDSLIAFLFFRT